MTCNFHTHTWRCNHAKPDERAYVLNARESGITTLGFADHVPYPFNNGHESWFRMRMDQTADYVDTVKALREEFRGEVDIHIGFEAEYYPAHFADLLTFLEPFDYEYLILGQHFLYNEVDAPYAAHATEEEKLLNDYVDQCIRAMNTGAFTYVAHPDLIRYEGDEGIYRAAVRRMCREAKACGIPLEVNLLGIGTQRHYPRRAFWEEVSVVGNDVVLGWDAHEPQAFLNTELEETAETMVEELGLHLLERPTLIRPHPRMAIES